MKHLILLAALAATVVAAAAVPATAAPTAGAGAQCKPFHNTARVITFARSKLTYIGFHPSIQFTCEHSRSGSYIGLLGVIDGEEYQGAIEKMGPRRIRLGITEHPAYPPGRALYTDSAIFNLSFEA